MFVVVVALAIGAGWVGCFFNLPWCVELSCGEFPSAIANRRQSQAVQHCRSNGHVQNNRAVPFLFDSLRLDICLFALPLKSATRTFSFLLIEGGLLFSLTWSAARPPRAAGHSLPARRPRSFHTCCHRRCQRAHVEEGNRDVRPRGRFVRRRGPTRCRWYLNSGREMIDRSCMVAGFRASYHTQIPLCSLWACCWCCC